MKKFTCVISSLSPFTPLQRSESLQAVSALRAVQQVFDLLDSEDGLPAVLRVSLQEEGQEPLPTYFWVPLPFVRTILTDLQEERARRPLLEGMSASIWEAATQEYVESYLAPRRAQSRVQYVLAAGRRYAQLYTKSFGTSIPEDFQQGFLYLFISLILLGEGGYKDEGGPGATTGLPLLPPDRKWRHKATIGAAWLRAIREAISSHLLPVHLEFSPSGESVVVGLSSSQEGVDPYPLGVLSPEGLDSCLPLPLWRCILRGMKTPDAKGVDGRCLPLFSGSFPDDMPRLAATKWLRDYLADAPPPNWEDDLSFLPPL